MFDDPSLNKKNQVPSNLPVGLPAQAGEPDSAMLRRGEPEDIFLGTDKAPSPLSPEQDASFSALPKPTPSSAVGAGILQPKTGMPKTSQTGPGLPISNEATPSKTADDMPKMHVMPPFMGSEETLGSGREEIERINKLKGPSFARNLLIGIIVLVVAGILGGGTWFIYVSFINPPVADDGFGIPQNNFDLSRPIAPEENQDVAEQDISSDIIDESVLFGEAIDTDGDNLNDDREVELGTDPNNWDTDNDDLSDGDEVLIWKTNPLNIDTDKDSFLDGEEVKNGYNPTGAGKIFEVPQ